MTTSSGSASLAATSVYACHLPAAQTGHLWQAHSQKKYETATAPGRQNLYRRDIAAISTTDNALSELYRTRYYCPISRCDKSVLALISPNATRAACYINPISHRYRRDVGSYIGALSDRYHSAIVLRYRSNIGA